MKIARTGTACNTVRCAVISEWTFASGRLVYGIHLACDSSHVHFPLCIIVYMTILLYSRLYHCIFIRFAHFHAFVIRVLLGYILLHCSTILVFLLSNRVTYENHFTEKLRSVHNNSGYFLTYLFLEFCLWYLPLFRRQLLCLLTWSWKELYLLFSCCLLIRFE